MKVVLLKDVKNIGKRDEIVTVSDGYARNFLFPQRLAAEATEGTIREIGKKRAAQDAREAEALAEARKKADSLKGKVIELAVKCGSQGRLYGSVTAAEAAEAATPTAMPTATRCPVITIHRRKCTTSSGPASATMPTSRG